MDVKKIAIKLYTANDGYDGETFIPVFHRWIQNQALPGHLLIDVADYAHVPRGPGTVLISSEANIYMERTEGRLALLYQRKLPLAGDFSQRLAEVTAEALKLAGMLESEDLSPKLSFKTDEILIRLDDRLLAPNNEKTFAATKPAITQLATALFKSDFKLTPNISPQTLFEVRIQSSSSPKLADLQDRVTAAPALSR